MVRLCSLALSGSDPDRIISEALREIRKTLRARMCWMFLVEQDKTILKSLGDVGSRRGPDESELLLKLSPKTLKRAYPIICNSVGDLYRENRALHGFLRQRKIEKFMGVLLNKDGRSIGVLNVGRDERAKDFTRDDLRSLTALSSMLVVSRLRAAEKESKQARGFLEGVIDNIPNPVFIKDRKHRFVVLNRALAKLTGHSREKMLGRSDYDFFPKDQADFFWKKDEEMFRTGRVVDIAQESITDKDGNVHYLHTKKAPLRSSSGRTTHLVGIIEDITERRRVEEALKQSEERFRLMTETSLDYSFQTDRNGMTVYCSPAVERVLGYTPEERQGMDFRSVIVRSDISKAQALFRRVMGGEAVQNLEIGLRHRSGKPVAVEVSVVPIFKNKEVTGLYGIARDITERKKAEGALRESEQKHRLLIESSDAAITLFDRNGTCLFLNSLAAKWLNGKPGDYVGKTLHDAFPKDLADMFLERLRRIIRSGVAESVEEVVQPLRARFLSSNLQPVRGPNGKVIGVQIVTHDITERKRAEAALRESERRYRALFDGAAEGILVADIQTRKLGYANPAICKMLGYAEEELTRMRLDDIHPRDSLKHVISEFQAQARGEKTLAPEIPCLRKDGAVIYADINTTQLLIDGRRCNVGFLTDITQRKQAEAMAEGERQRLFSVLDVMPALVYLQAPDYSVPFVNRRFRELFGDPKNRPCYECFYGRKKPCEPCTTLRVLKTRAPQTYEWTSKEGRTYMIHEDLFPGNHGTEMVLGTGLDITEHKRTEKALVQKERVARERARVLADLHQLNQIDDILTRVCRAVRDSGLFERAVMTLHEPGGRICRVGQVGLPAAAVRRAQRAAPIDRRLKDKITGKKFRISDSFFVPSDAGVDFRKSDRYIPQKKTRSAGGDWRPGDELFVPLRDFSGKIMGYMSVDTPTDGCRPDVKTVQSLEMLVEAAASRIREVQAQQALTEGEERYRLLVENLTDMIVEFDREGRLLFVSPSYCQTFGKSEDEILGRKFMPLIHRDDREKVKKDLAGIYEPPHVAYVEERAQTIAGWRWQSWVNTAVLDQNGDIVRIVAVGRDITKRKQADEDLQRSEDRYRSLFEDSPISLWEEDFSEVKKYIDRLRESGVTDFRTYFDRHPKAVAKCASMIKVIDVNKASLKLYKAGSKEELITGLGAIFSRESYYPFREELIAIAQGKTVFEKEAITKTLKGTDNHVSVRWTVPPGFEETLSKVVVAVTDITEAKEAEEALRREEERYRTLVETAQEGIGIADSKENLVFVNRAFAGMLGYRRDELLGKNLHEISHGTQYDVFREETKKRKQGKPSRYEITLLTKERKPKPMYVSAAPLWNADGSFRGTLGVVSDLTEIKKAREYNILLGASRSLSRTLKFGQVLKLGAEKMALALNADRCTVMLPGDAVSGSSIRLQVYPFPNKGKGSLLAWNLRTAKEHLSSYKRSLRAQGSIQIPDLRSDLVPSLGKRIVRKGGMASALVVPMFLRNTMLGVFHVGMKKKARTFSLEEERLARTMANQVGVALQNCKLMEDLREEHARIIEQAQLLSTQYREQKMMFELTQTLSSSRHLDHLLASAARKVTEFLKTERGSIALIDPEEDGCRLRAVHVRGEPRTRDSVDFTFTFKAYPGLKNVLLEHKPFILQDASSLPKEDPVRRYFLGQGIKSTIAVPLVSRGKCLGFLTAAAMTEVHQFTKEEIRLLQTISNPIAVTIENYGLLEDLKNRYAQIEEQAAILKRQTHEQEVLLKLSRALSETTNVDQVIQTATRMVISVLGVDRCSVLFTTESGSELELKGVSSADRADLGKLKGKRFPWLDIPAATKAIKKGRAFAVGNVAGLPPMSAIGKHTLKTGVKSILGTGMFFGRELAGVLVVSNVRQHKTFQPEEIRLFQTMANQIAVAVENARLQQVVEKHAQALKDLYSESLKTQEDERKKIARELHDQVGQMLQSMKMNLDWIRRGLTSKPEKPAKLEDWLLDTHELLARTIEDIRDLTFELRPSVLDDFGLIPGLKWYVDIYSRRSGVKVSLKTREKEYRFPPEVVTALYRIIQEALTNVAKHARASLVSVSVSQKGSTAVLSVRDNGIGFDSSKWLSVPKGMGLLNIKERVNMLGGSFEIISRPRKGTKLNIQIPFSGGAV